MTYCGGSGDIASRPSSIISFSHGGGGRAIGVDEGAGWEVPWGCRGVAGGMPWHRHYLRHQKSARAESSSFRRWGWPNARICRGQCVAR